MSSPFLVAVLRVAGKFTKEAAKEGAQRLARYVYDHFPPFGSPPTPPPPTPPSTPPPPTPPSTPPPPTPPSTPPSSTPPPSTEWPEEEETEFERVKPISPRICKFLLFFMSLAYLIQRASGQAMSAYECQIVHSLIVDIEHEPVNVMRAMKAESKSTNDASKDQPLTATVPSTTSNAESSTSTAKLEEELKLSSRLRKFAFNDLKLATRNFRPESLLGEGGFGCVFKGWVEENGTAPVKPGMGLTVAVKTLNHDGLQGHKEWLAEVIYLGELIHPNLVKLIGYCMEDDQGLLVYEFMPRGSLENHLLRSAAKGLTFLHEEAEKPVIYRDFKTSNILLDAEYNAKLSDFGLAKDGPEEGKTHVSTLVMGTYVYAAPEYVMTGSLPLPWSIRMKIALGAAKGLTFLHEEAEKPVIYHDFKTSNILLDAEYNAKLSDFGLAKDGPEEGKTHVSTRVMGTYGYAAPEYVMTGHLTSRSDVYSFEVVLLEMITGRRSMDKSRPNGEHNLVEWARPHLGDQRRFYRLVDPRLEGHFSMKGAQKAVQLASRCLCRDPKARPLMSEVVDILKPLPHLKDMASSSNSFQSMQSEAGPTQLLEMVKAKGHTRGTGSNLVSGVCRYQMVLVHHHITISIIPRLSRVESLSFVDASMSCLSFFLRSTGSLPLPWSIRMKIALGAAKGLTFLHEEAEKPVIYRDFKTSNILLDAEYNAKLSDFGLAKDGPEEGKTHVSTRVMGTYGYAAPEYVMTEIIECLKTVAKRDVELTVEERNLLSMGYKNVIGARRVSWRIMSSIDQMEESKWNENSH